nr:MAG TPA: hypothetical protein [Bacteriophage sp.]
MPRISSSFLSCRASRIFPCVRRSREASTHDIHSLGDSGKNPNTHERRKDT